MYNSSPIRVNLRPLEHHMQLQQDIDEFIWADNRSQEDQGHFYGLRQRSSRSFASPPVSSRQSSRSARHLDPAGAESLSLPCSLPHSFSSLSPLISPLRQVHRPSASLPALVVITTPPVPFWTCALREIIAGLLAHLLARAPAALQAAAHARQPRQWCCCIL